MTLCNWQLTVVWWLHWATAKSTQHPSTVSRSQDHSNKTSSTKQICHKSKRSSIDQAIAGNAYHTNVDHLDYSIHLRKKAHSIRFRGGCHGIIVAWIIGPVVCRDHANVNAVFRAAASIQPNGVIVMLIIMVSSIFGIINFIHIRRNVLN